MMGGKYFKLIKKRYVVLILCCIIICGLYFGYDIPGSLQNQIIKEFHISTYTFSYLYSVYSWPNIIMCFLSGYLIDRVLGVRLGSFVFVLISALGQLIFVVGGNINELMMMMAGRFIFGIGCESTNVAMNNYAVVWFNDKELNMVFALMMNMGRIGSSLVFQASEPTYYAIAKQAPEMKVLGYTLIALGSTSVIIVICAIFVALMKPKKKLEEPKEISVKPIEPKVTHFLDFLAFPLQFWLLSIITSFYFAVFYGFLGQSQRFFTIKFGVSDATANGYVFFFSIFGAFLSPCLGIFIDKKGQNMYFIILAHIFGVIGFFLLAYTYINPYIAMFFLSTSMASFLCSVWALFSYIISEHQLATAYGITQALMNLTLSISTVASGATAEHFGFENMVAFLLAWLLVSLPLLFWSWIKDLRGSKILNMSPKERANFMEEKRRIHDDDERKPPAHRLSLIEFNIKRWFLPFCKKTKFTGDRRSMQLADSDTYGMVIKIRPTDTQDEPQIYRSKGPI